MFQPIPMLTDALPPWYEEEYYQLPPEDWAQYRGSNSETFVGFRHPIRDDGDTSFSQLLGRPLDREMWALLVLRWHPRSLWIIGPTNEQWCIYPMAPAMILYVDAADVVKDVEIRLVDSR